MNNKPKSILLISQFFFPENFKSNDIAFELVKKGYVVNVLTSIPNYPNRNQYPTYGFFRKRIETVEDVKIFRAFQFPRAKKNSSWRIAFNYISFAICSTIWAIFISLRKKYDCIIVHQTSPITQALPAIIINKIYKTPIYLWVLDLWPEAVYSGSGTSNNLIIKPLYWFTKLVYQKVYKILISSKDFEKSILNKGDFTKKLIYFPNWSIDFLNFNIEDDAIIPKLPEGFLIVFAGNIGVSQDIESVVQLALEFKFSKDVKFVIIGEGSRHDWLKDKINELELEEIVFPIGHYPLKYMPLFYNQAKALLLTLSGQYDNLSLYVPAKLQSYMSASKPIIAMINGTSRKIIEEANCGYAVEAGDYKKLADIINSVILPDVQAFESLGHNGRNYFTHNYKMEVCINNLCNIIEN